MDDHPSNTMLATTRTVTAKSLDRRMLGGECYPVRRGPTPGIIRAAISDSTADSIR